MLTSASLWLRYIILLRGCSNHLCWRNSLHFGPHTPPLNEGAAETTDSTSATFSLLKPVRLTRCYCRPPMLNWIVLHIVGDIFINMSSVGLNFEFAGALRSACGRPGVRGSERDALVTTRGSKQAELSLLFSRRRLRRVPEPATMELSSEPTLYLVTLQEAKNKSR